MMMTLPLESGFAVLSRDRHRQTGLIFQERPLGIRRAGECRRQRFVLLLMRVGQIDRRQLLDLHQLGVWSLSMAKTQSSITFSFT